MAKRASPLDETFPPAPFEGFKPGAMRFFRDLEHNQDKAWMAEHKPDYEAHVRKPLQALVAAVSDELARARLPLKGDPARALFRLNRDVRFSKDKRPYNTHASAVLTRDGEKHSPGVLYIHVDPSGSFIACGFFRPEPPVLQRLRERLAGDAAGWAKVERALGKADMKLATDDTLVRPPKGFEAAASAVVDALKLKSWIVRHELSPAQLAKPGLVEDIAGFARAARPLLDFGWSALELQT